MNPLSQTFTDLLSLAIRYRTVPEELLLESGLLRLSRFSQPETITQPNHNPRPDHNPQPDHNQTSTHILQSESPTQPQLPAPHVKPIFFETLFFYAQQHVCAPIIWPIVRQLVSIENSHWASMPQRIQDEWQVLSKKTARTQIGRAHV